MYCWGYGSYFARNYEIIERVYGVIEGVIDNSASKWGATCREKCKCLSPNDVPKGAEVLITVENKKVCEQIRNDVLDHGFLEVETEYNMQQKKKTLMLCGTIDECQKMHYLLNRNDSDYAVNYYITPFAEELGINNVYGVPIISVFMAERLMQMGGKS